MNKVAIALVHYPIVDREGAIITTAITNLDLHDLSRSACTYGVSALYIVHPVEAQRQLAERVKAHWVAGSGARRIPTREAALSLMRIVPSLEDVYAELGGRALVDLYVTSARREQPGMVTYVAARERIASATHTPLILFGTGWGLAPRVVADADAFLAPVGGANPTGYNHLSVRAACAIVLDRLLSPAEAAG